MVVVQSKLQVCFLVYCFLFQVGSGVACPNPNPAANLPVLHTHQVLAAPESRGRPIASPGHRADRWPQSRLPIKTVSDCLRTVLVIRCPPRSEPSRVIEKPQAESRQARGETSSERSLAGAQAESSAGAGGLTMDLPSMGRGRERDPEPWRRLALCIRVLDSVRSSHKGHRGPGGDPPPMLIDMMCNFGSAVLNLKRILEVKGSLLVSLPLLIQVRAIASCKDQLLQQRCD